MKALLLARVSSKEQEEGQSIPAQERRLREYADRKGFIVEQVFKITESSTKDTRKEFEKILEVIRKSKETKALVADTIDRVQRSFKESVVLEELRKEGKVEIHFMREGLILNRKSNSSDISPLGYGGHVRQKLCPPARISQKICLIYASSWPSAK